jgi:xylan 1,4-beta-xylosidase
MIFIPDGVIRQVKRALPAARVGGPHCTGPADANAAKFLKEFLHHCKADTNYVTGRIGAPLDFIAFHAKGSPRFINGAVRMNMGIQLCHISGGFQIVASDPVYKDLPIIIGESDPEGCAACGMTNYPQNGYRNGTMFSSYTASCFAKIYDLALYHNINLLGVVSWSFEFENQPWFHGFRDLATNGVDKPVLNVFRMFSMMKGQRVEAKSNTGFSFSMVIDSGVRKSKSDINAIAAKESNVATVMIWNYHDDDLPAPDATIDLVINAIPSKKVQVFQYRIDNSHSNSYEIWKKMGSPQNPSPDQRAELENASQLQMIDSPETKNTKSGTVTLPTVLPRQGVALYKIEWK